MNALSAELTGLSEPVLLVALSEAITIGESGTLTPLITHRVTAEGVTAF